MRHTPRTLSPRPLALLFALAALALTLALAACGGSSGSDSEATAADATNASADVTEAASAPTEGVEVKVGILQGATLAAVAKEIGSFEKELAKDGATVAYAGPFPAMVPAIEAMNAGDADITYGSISAAIGALAGESDFKVFAIEPQQPDNEGIIVAKDSGITSVEGLKGKKIAVNKAGTGEYLTLLALDQAGLSKDDVELVDLAPPEAAAAFGSGQVDAWATWSSFTGLAQTEMGGTMLVTGGELGSKNDTPYIVSTEFAEKYPTLLASLYRALDDAANWIKQNPDKAEQFYVEEGLSPTVAKAQVESGGVLLPINDPAQVERFQSVADYVYEKGVVPVEVDMTDRTVNVEEAQ